MGRYIKDRKRIVLGVYIVVCIAVLILQIVVSGKYDVERVTYGYDQNEGYALTKDTVIEAEFLACYDELSGVGFFYFSNGNTYDEGEIVLDFYVDGEKEEDATTSFSIAQIMDETQVFVPFERSDMKGKTITVKIYGNNLSSDEEKCPLIGISEYTKTQATLKINGKLKDEFLTMDAYFRIMPAQDYTKYMGCAIAIIVGIMIYILAVRGCISVDFPKRGVAKEKKPVKKIKWRNILFKKKVIVGFVLILVSMVVLLEYTYHFSVRDYANEGQKVRVNKSDSNSEALLLKYGNTVHQSFLSTDENLGGIGLTLQMDSEDVEGNIILKIGIEGSQEPIFENYYSLSEILTEDAKQDESESYIYMEFPQILNQSKGVNYTISIELENAEQSDIMLQITEKGGTAKGSLNDGNSTFNLVMDSYYMSNLFLKTMYKILSVVLIIFILAIYLACFVWKRRVDQLCFPIFLCLGIIYCFLIPLYSTPDEPSHVDTAYRVSNQIMGIEDTDSPYTMYKRTSDLDIEPQTDLTVESYRTIYENLFTKCSDDNLIETFGRNNLNNALAIFYLPAALGLTAGRLLGLGFLPALMLGRLFNLLAATVLMSWGIKKIPFGKTVMFMIGILPITLQQIMSFSYDAVIIGLSYVYIGYCLRWAYTDKRIHVAEVASMFIIAYMLATCKGGVYLPLTFLIFLVPLRRVKLSKGTVAFWGSIAVILVMFFAEQNLSVFSTLSSVQGTVVGGATTEELYSFSYFLQNPIELVRIFENTFYSQGDSLLHTTLGGRLGWLSVQLQWIVAIAFLWLIVLSALKGKGEKQYIYAKDKIWMGLVALGSFVLVMLSMLVSWTSFGSEEILGVQGRYFLPFLGLVFFLLRNQQLMYQKKREQNLVFAGCMVEMVAISQILLGIFV